MNIRSCIAALVLIQGRLSIALPVVSQIKVAYNYFPAQDVLLPDVPCWANAWTMLPEERGGGLRIQQYTVHMQLFVDDVASQAADIATSFHGALVDALDADVGLSGDVAPHVAAPTCSSQVLRGGNPTLVRLERGGRAYIGLDEYLDITMKEGKAFS